jgi:hypothetical protein
MRQWIFSIACTQRNVLDTRVFSSQSLSPSLTACFVDATVSADCCHHPSRASKVDQLRGTDLEKKVKEATSNENWGAPNSLLREIARASFD